MWPFNKKTEVPQTGDLEQAFDYSEFTPDIALLQQKETQLLFVCDEMQRGHPRFNLIEEHSIPLGVVFTKDQFVMYKRKAGLESYAIPLDESFFMAHKGAIRGELHAVKSMRYIELDTFYENGLKFERRRVTVHMPYIHKGTREDGSGFIMKRTADIRCFMYVGIQEHWNKMMSEEDDGFFLFEKVRLFTPNNPELTRYYHFSRLEYEDY